MSEDMISDLELAALVSSRICHDVISPVGAIGNGLEVLADEDDEDMRVHALDLIKKSAAQASAKLQFARLAFGAAGSAGAAIDLRDAERVVRGIVDTGKAELSWNTPVANMPKDRVKLLLNLVHIVNTALPRGGAITVHVSDDIEAPQMSVRGEGDIMRLPANLESLLGGGNGIALDAHTIQPFYTGRVARASGMSLQLASTETSVSLNAGPV